MTTTSSDDIEVRRPETFRILFCDSLQFAPKSPCQQRCSWLSVHCFRLCWYIWTGLSPTSQRCSQFSSLRCMLSVVILDRGTCTAAGDKWHREGRSRPRSGMVCTATNEGIELPIRTRPQSPASGLPASASASRLADPVLVACALTGRLLPRPRFMVMLLFLCRLDGAARVRQAQRRSHSLVGLAERARHDGTRRNLEHGQRHGQRPC